MQWDIIETERLVLRILTPKKMNEIFSTHNDEEIREILAITSEEDFERQKRMFHEGYESFNRSMLNFQLVEKSTDTILGYCGFHSWNPQHHRAEIGYNLVNDSFKRKGFMKEALEKVLDYGFRIMQLNRIEGIIDDNNTASKKLLEYYGFQKEGTLRGHYLVGDVFENSELYSLLREDKKSGE